ncbi:hypothetical protein N6H18_15850 [Reichenbachiella agarivorans]|uniref:Collagen triple helix repeat-containing protein n=1 Tax=Reichenbachiella agarivorans TaxID=2979464 RepID=A0ABY6CMT4_9BACT|nr:hypothetical protein [Reichenbachiella agarivorans]UXP31821.1 hypothetical protein N6H18_15850 [Reichenbachiella agarivorans]
MKKIIYLFLIAACCSLTLGSCISEEGEPGPAGEAGVDGQDGVDGVDGVDGQDGQNGVGFDELTKYGSIKVYLDGTRPDGVLFKDTSDFKYTATDVFSDSYIGGLSGGNIITKGDNEELSFDILRFLSSPDDIYQESITAISLDVVNNVNSPFEFFSIGIKKSVLTSDFKVFSLYIDNSFYTDKLGSLSGASITDYSYDESTGNVKFKFSFEVLADDNSTGYPLKISGEVNAIVFENIGTDYYEECGEC